MPVTLNDENIQKLGAYIAKFFTERLHAEEISPLDFITAFEENTKLFKGIIIPKAQELWEQQDSEAETEQKRLIDDTLLFFRKPDSTSPEEKLRSLLPEDKIVINKKTFRTILNEIDFSTLSSEEEKRLLSRLKVESIGLNEQEIFIYFNLIKLSAVGAKGTKSGDIRSAVTGTIDSGSAAEEILQAVNRNIAALDNCKSINENKALQNDIIKNVLIDKIKTEKLPAVPGKIICGCYAENQNLLLAMKNFLKLTCDKWGVNIEETLQYLAVLIILNGLDDKYMTRVGVSRNIINFVTGKAARLKPITSASIRFIFLFSTVLASQITEINKKYRQMPPIQQEKLTKLYGAAERRSMLIQSASNFAFQKIAYHKAELIDVSKNFALFISKTPNLITTKEMFTNEYT